MKIAILSRSPKAYSTRRLCEAATGHGHQVEVLNTLELGIHVEQAQPSLTHRTTRASLSKPLSLELAHRLPSLEPLW